MALCLKKEPKSQPWNVTPAIINLTGERADNFHLYKRDPAKTKSSMAPREEKSPPC